MCRAGCPTRPPCVWGFEPSSRRGFNHDAVRANPTGSQIRLRFSRISSSSRKQLWVGHVFFCFGTGGLQELVEAEEFAAEGGAVGGPFVVAGGRGEGGADGGELGIEAGGASLTLRHGSGWPTLCDFVLCLPAAGRQRVGNSLLRGQPNHRPTIGL